MSNKKYDIVKGDTFGLINTLNDHSIDLLITSPPYNVGKVYEKEVDLHSYLTPYTEFANIVYTKISPGGSICWEVGNYVKDGEVFPLDIYFYDIFKNAGFKLRNRIVWHFEHGLHASKRFSGRYETILWFTKNDEYTFNLGSVRVPSKYPGKLHYKGEKKGLPSGNPLGKNPSDLWTVLTKDWECELWNIPNVKSNHPEKTIHPCQFPIELVQRCILALSNAGNTVFDPFMGVGSVLIAAMLHDRKGLGFEINDEYIAIADKRINDYLNNNLKIRPIGKPVYKPTGRDKVSQIPLSWVNNAA
jgi:DNA modification methylase